MIQLPQIDSQSPVPVYRQLYDGLRSAILDGSLKDGDKLPATRELAAQLCLNRATVTAAYDLLETDGLISGQVGRGSYVQSPAAAGANPNEISFATSRPSEDLFPMAAFRETAGEVIHRHASQILQLGSPFGYAPLREFLIAEAIADGVFNPAQDDLMVTSGCQQALDLIHRTLIEPGQTVLASEPVYPGLKNAFGATLASQDSPSVQARVLTPSFSNPTGATMSLAERERVVESETRLLIEIDIYSRLRYRGAHLPPLRALNQGSSYLLLRSFSKIAFPGLRVGWIIAAKPIIQRLAQTKQHTDLHSDQLSQAIMLEFARTGRLQNHLDHVLAAGRSRLETTIQTLSRILPAGASFTRPEGGMNLWVTLPPGCDAQAVLEKSRRDGVHFLPGRYFAISRPQNESFRISFAGLSPARIAEGLRRLQPFLEDEVRLASRYPQPLAELAMV
jgi:2-aminoadipate transaminase